MYLWLTLFICAVFLCKHYRFDMMGKRVYKTYADLTNIVIRVSDGTPEGKEHAVLVNAHLDSTLPSPGAADDALSVGVMLECIRVLTHTPGWTPAYAVVFCGQSDIHIHRSFPY
jgi:Zn-dependent M28 family amino/carboxypeptidase